jgi:hypothetical protein
MFLAEAALSAAIATAQNAFQGPGGVGGGIRVDPRREIQRLVEEVTAKQRSLELHAGARLGICQLYAHFFLSILALMEVSFRLMIQIVILVGHALLYYVIMCLACGKMQDLGWSYSHQLHMYSFYSYIMCGIAGNVLRPWNPPMPGFNVTGCFFAAPRLEGFDNRVVHRRDEISCLCTCCFCCPNPAIENLPSYKLLQSSVFFYGGMQAVHCVQCCSTDNDYRSYVDKLNVEVEAENVEATVQFFQREYNCNSFYDLVAQRLNIHLSPPPPPQNATTNRYNPAPPQPQQVYLPASQGGGYNSSPYNSAPSAPASHVPVVYATVVNP